MPLPPTDSPPATGVSSRRCVCAAARSTACISFELPLALRRRRARPRATAASPATLGELADRWCTDAGSGKLLASSGSATSATSTCRAARRRLHGRRRRLCGRRAALVAGARHGARSSLRRAVTRGASPALGVALVRSRADRRDPPAAAAGDRATQPPQTAPAGERLVRCSVLKASGSIRPVVPLPWADARRGDRRGDSAAHPPPARDAPAGELAAARPLRRWWAAWASRST